ncbi:MAG: hypothetical protein BGO43_03695 [Gammaproteobacteria bacterium 39-13]|nr:hypothetical protein [Gammaproteobacteria bacterium]OJV96497.1 MAG: hypothetical protein BGO43_03695 [Gammaproteobacteria bacterium 39-13]
MIEQLKNRFESFKDNKFNVSIRITDEKEHIFSHDQYNFEIIGDSLWLISGDDKTGHVFVNLNNAICVEFKK